MGDQRGESSTAPSEEALADPRPAADPLAMAATRARAERALFGQAEPMRIGRYEIVGRLGDGGMGVVYAARDPDLDRRVALKVLQPRRYGDERSRQRLLTEARALAKLDHSNIVRVHDVLREDEHSVIVMELVEGQTLADWTRAERRDWRSVVAIYAQAVAGLAAAHGIDVIHRDFKPSNAMLGADGRVRVLDFGLACVVATSSEESAGTGGAMPIDLTLTGDVVGTLAYAAPEQLRAEPSSAASDQFSACVALYAALENALPFAGETVSERLASIATGPRPFTEGALPIWLRAAIARGLAAAPGGRHPSTAELLLELQRSRGWRRWRMPMLIGAIAAASVVGTLALRPEPAVTTDACDGGRDQIASVWNPAARRRVLDAIDRVGSPFAQAVRGRIAAQLDRYAADWSAGHLAACREHRRGTTSAAMLDRRMTCLGQELGDLHAALDTLGAVDATTVINSTDVVARLPPVSRCADLERLAAAIEPPATQAKREAVAAVRARISAAEALSRVGRSAEARAAGEAAMQAASAAQYQPVQVEAALAHSRILISHHELRAAAEPLRQAREFALANRMAAEAVEAIARLIYVEAMIMPDLTGTERDLSYARPMSERTVCGPACDHFVRPLLFNNVGVAFLAAGKRAEAFESFTRARRELGSYAPADLELTIIDRNLAMLTADAGARVALAAGVWERQRTALGELHPLTLDDLTAYAEYVVDAAEAQRLMTLAAAAYRAYHPTLRRQIALTESGRGLLARELGDDATARVAYAAALAATADESHPDLVILHGLVTGEFALVDGDAAGAIAALGVVSRARLNSPAWYERALALRAEVGLGLAELARGDEAAARVHLETAVAGYPAILAMNEEVIHRRFYARAQHALAGVLRRAGMEPDRMARLSAESTAYRKAAGLPPVP